MKKIFCLVLLFGVFIIACRGIGKSFKSYEFSDDNIIYKIEPSYYWIFADLKGNGEEYLLSASVTKPDIQTLLIKDQTGKTITQINFTDKIRNIKVLIDPRNQDRWLFTSINNQESTRIKAFKYIWENQLKREEKDFESIARMDTLKKWKSIEWVGTINPILLEDINQDNRLELLCSCTDCYTVNPRGLVLYDFDSGRILWRFDFSTQPYSVLCDDFNNDGIKEIICSNFALKNTTEAKNGIDDYHTWLMVFDINGKLIYLKKENDGYGNIGLVSDDLNKDEKKEIIAIISSEGNSYISNTVQTYNWTGKSLIKIANYTISESFEENDPSIVYNSMDQKENKLLLLAVNSFPLLALDDKLNKIQSKYKYIVVKVWDVEDLNQDGTKEILIQTADNRFVVLDNKLKEKASLENPFSNKEKIIAQIVKAGFGKPSRIVLSTDREVRFYKYQKLPFIILAWRFIDSNIEIICILLSLLIILILISNFYNRNYYKLTVDNISQGTILLSNKDKISYMNKYVVHLLSDQFPEIRYKSINSLSEINSELSIILKNFSKSKLKEIHTTLNLGSQNLTHFVHIKKLSGFFHNYLIILKPINKMISSDSDKLAWADTARRLSHNVRRHITNIILALKPLQENDSIQGQKKYADIVRDEIEKIRIYTHAFQRFTELKDYDLKLQDIIPSLEHCLSRINIPDNITLIKNWDLKSIEAWIEPIRFEEALYNLINNSIESMSDGGSLSITVKNFPNHISAKCKLSNMVEIEDTGKGIPNKYIEEIWQPFFTTKDSGTGIGLPETKKIIESMGGKIFIQSEENQGTVVTIWLKGVEDG